MTQISRNHIKMGTSSKNSIYVGDFSVGVSGGDDYGPTIDTGFYNGITPPVGGYVIYVQKMSQGPSIHVPQDDNECLYYLNKYGANATNIADALNWALTQSTLIVRSAEYTLQDLPGAAQPTTGQTSLYLTQVDGSDNWYYVILDFTNNTITGPIDMGLSSYDYNNNIGYMNEGGFMVVLSNNSDWQERTYFFISANGVLVESYQRSGGYNFNDGYGIGQCYISDMDNGVFKYFDGIHIYTRDISGYTNFIVPYFYELGGLDGGILTQRDESDDTKVEYNHQGNVILLHTVVTADYYLDTYNYCYGTYTIILNVDRTLDVFDTMYVYDNLTGNQLQNIQINGVYSYQGYDTDFYGTGKAIFLFRNYYDNAVPYKIVSYDGVRDHWTETYQDNNGNYNNYNNHYTNDYPYMANGNPSETFFYDFYGNNDNQYNGFMNQYEYFKTLTYYDNHEGPSVFTLNDNGATYGSPAINRWSYGISNHLYRLISTGLTYVDVLILGESTERIVPTGILLCDGINDGMSDVYHDIIGQDFYFQSYSGNSTNYSDYTAYVVGNISGSTFDIKASKRITSNSTDYWAGSGYVLLVDFENSKTYYYNSTVSDFTEIDSLQDMSSSGPTYFFNPPYFEKRPAYIFYSTITFEAYVLTKNTLSEKVTLGQTDGSSWNIQIGKSGVLHAYTNNDNGGKVTIDIYDLSLNRTQRILTDYYNVNEANVIKDRYYVKLYNGDNDTNVHYIMTQTSHSVIETRNSNYSGPVPNDFVYGY